MDAAQLKKCRQQLRRRVPLIGGWLHDQVLKSLAEDGAAEAVRVLEEAARHTGEESLRGAALDRLQQLAAGNNVPAQEALCRLVTQDADSEALAIVSSAGYLPHDEVHRALFFFLCERWKEYEALDFDHRLLREAYDAAEPRLRARIAARARRAGRVEWVDAVAGSKQGRRLALLSGAEWRTALTVLEGKERWDDLWRLAQEAPPCSSAAMLRSLKKARWLPREIDRSGFQELAALARKWKESGLRHLIFHRATLAGHASEVRCLAITPSGDLLASGGADSAVCLWSLPDGKLLKRLERHNGWLNCLAITPDGRTLASAGRDGRVCLWSLPGGRPLAKLKGHKQPVFSLAVSPDGAILASGSSDATIRLWDVRTRKLLAVLKRHEGGISALAISPDGKLLASASGDCSVRLWRLPSGRAARMLEEHRDEADDSVYSVAFSPDGRLLASGGTDTWVLLWSVPDGMLLRTLKGHIGHVTNLVITSDGKLLASGGRDHMIRLWHLPSGRLAANLEGLAGDNGCILFSPDGQFLYCSSGGGVGMDHTVRVWSVPDRRIVRVLAGHTRHVTCLALSADGQWLASGSGDSTIRLWSAELARLSETPVGQTTLQDLAWIQSVAQDGAISARERPLVDFIAALMRWRRRLDILVDEAGPRVIELGEFDIEIEG
jgi:WD40 repeat protein